MFRVRDPELWTSILNEDLVLKSQIVDGNFPAGSMGELLQRSLLESEKRADAGNVTPLKKPSNPE